MARAQILLHGATGFTGRLVAAELEAANVQFAISGRDATKLADLAAKHRAHVIEEVAFDIGEEAAVEAAITGRTIVIACAGPFSQVGMPVLAASAKLGVHYVDTTGEQSFVRAAHRLYNATAEASGACIVPAMAYEIAPADWAAHMASEEVGGAPDHLDIVYLPETRNGLAMSTSRGTRKTMVRMTALGDTESYQFVDGALVQEPPAEIVKTFTMDKGHTRSTMSFPSPEAVVTSAHTKARTLRTFMAAPGPSAELAHLFRHVLPAVVRFLEPTVVRLMDRGVEGPAGDGRAAEFTVFAEASKGKRFARVTIRGVDPYGLTARITTHAALSAIGGKVVAKGVVGPSVGYPAVHSIAALGLAAGVTVDVRDS